jgi:hypothetical protein
MDNGGFVTALRKSDDEKEEDDRVRSVALKSSLFTDATSTSGARSQNADVIRFARFCDALFMLSVDKGTRRSFHSGIFATVMVDSRFMRCPLLLVNQKKRGELGKTQLNS